MPQDFLTSRDLENISLKKRNDFPFFTENPKWIYFDTAATSLTPSIVTSNINEYYHKYSANIHRGTYGPASEAAQKTETTRNKVLKFLNANDEKGIIFTRNTTESINLLAYSLMHSGKELNEFFTNWNGGIDKDDIIILSESEHHSNIIPWQQISHLKGAKIYYIPIQKDGTLNTNAFYEFINESNLSRIKIISLASVSNITGIHHDLSFISEFSEKNGNIFIIDGAQEISHSRVDLQSDNGKKRSHFYVFSGHKAYGPTGIGAVIGNKNIFNKMYPYQTGGNMIEKVEKENSTFAQYPYRFEAGTLNIGGIFGLGAALDYLEITGMDFIEKREKELTYYAFEKGNSLGYTIYGPDLKKRLTSQSKAFGVLSLNIPGIHHYDAGSYLAEKKIALRTGHHCGQIFMDAMKIPGTIRISLSFLNLKHEIDYFFEITEKVKKLF